MKNLMGTFLIYTIMRDGQQHIYLIWWLFVQPVPMFIPTFWNEKIKGANGATHLLNRADVPGLGRWETYTTEIARIIESEQNTEAKTTESHIMKAGVPLQT